MAGTGTLTHSTEGLFGDFSVTGTARNGDVSLALTGSAFDAATNDTAFFTGRLVNATTITGTLQTPGGPTTLTFRKQ